MQPSCFSVAMVTKRNAYSHDVSINGRGLKRASKCKASKQNYNVLIIFQKLFFYHICNLLPFDQSEITLLEVHEKEEDELVVKKVEKVTTCSHVLIPINNVITIRRGFD